MTLNATIATKWVTLPVIAEVADDLDPDLAATTEEGLDPMTDTEEAIEDGTIPTQTALDLPKEITEDGKTAALDLTIAVTETIDALTAANVQEVLVIVEIKVGTETNSLAVMEESSPAHQSDAPKVNKILLTTLEFTRFLTYF